ncbi:MAG TPA: hypothetical protein VGP63_18645 [Planctomycetaceae bacterium]|jgi:hypothetical protein|nr:hypothetical protein [Planctomycetaceae bacterium]
MPAPLFFIVWGTKVRTRHVDYRGDFCPGCLRLAKFKVLAIDKASHVYYIRGPYREVLQYAECPVCATQIRLPSTSVPAEPTSPGDSVVDLVKRNLLLTNAHLEELASSICNKFPGESRNLHALRTFCTNANAEFKRVESNVSGWCGLIAIACIALAVPAFLKNLVLGICVSVVLLAVLLVARHWLIQTGMRKALRPRLEKLFQTSGLEWSDLEAALERDLKFPRLRRHLLRGHFGDLQFGAALDGGELELASIELEDYLALQGRPRLAASRA